MKLLSVALAVFNEEKNIRECLISVSKWADEIICVDGGSTDRTCEIAKEYGAKIIKTNNPAIFHINKQKAVEACEGKWILQLDADEVVSEALRKEIEEVCKGEMKFAGYYIPRKNFFAGHWLHKGGQYPDYVIRLFLRGKGYIPAKSVHEQISIDGEVGKLTEPLLHYSYHSIKEYLYKADVYTTLTAKEMKENHIPNTFYTWITYRIIKPIRTFFTIYIRHKGFTDGKYGFLFAYFSAVHHITAYQKFLK